MSPRPRTVSIFCGGRGSSSLLRELIRHPGVNLNILVNAYDDGLSTGALRRLIPGMLGPSDFRKNLSYVLELYSKQQFDLVRILEFRLEPGFPEASLARLVDYLRGRGGGASVPAPILALFTGLGRELMAKLGGYLETFQGYCRRSGSPFDLGGCALGNLLFAGAYLQNGQSFNAAVRDLARTMGCTANLINVTRGENRILVGLKADGELLDCEARIVGPQSSSRIVGIYLLPRSLTDEERAGLDGLDLDGKRRFLESAEAPVEISEEARAAVLESDLIIYGPGTQFSSLLPSYKTRGLRAALAASRARVKALFVNLRRDHDIRGLGADDIVDQALAHLGDADNAQPSISHVLYSRGSATGATGLAGGEPPPGRTRYRGAEWIAGDFESRSYPGIHNGHRSVETAFALLQRADGSEREQLDLYVDLHERSLAANLLVQEFAELDWARRFSKVRLCLNGVELPAVRLGDGFELRASSSPGLFSEVDVFRDWLLGGTSQYLVTLTGDGEFRLKDILAALEVLDSTNFGAVFGSRSQSRLQFHGALEYAYGESKPLFWLSWLGGYMFSALFALRFQVTLSDPFTGFRVYRRSAFTEQSVARFEAARIRTASHISKYLLASSVEVAEIPVSYRTFQGFTRARTRLLRGLKNAVGLFV